MILSTPAMRYTISPRTIRRYLLAGLAALLLLLPATAYAVLEQRAAHEGGPAASAVGHPGAAAERTGRHSRSR